MQLLRTLLTFIAWPLRLILFLLLAILASLNLQESTVFLFLGHQWHAPMAVLLLIAFTTGAVLGVIALTLRRARKSAKAEVSAPAANAAAESFTPKAASGPPSLSSLSYDAPSVAQQDRL